MRKWEQGNRAVQDASTGESQGGAASERSRRARAAARSQRELVALSLLFAPVREAGDERG